MRPQPFGATQGDMFSDDPFIDAPKPAPTLTLREYQKECVSKIIWSKNKGLEGNELVILPTGAGKSVVIAAIARTLNEPILILQPSKEILEQNYEKLLHYVDASEIGIYSASMDERTIRRYTLATIQSIYTKSDLFKHFRLVIIDEAHLVNPTTLGGMFTSFLRDIGHPKVIGFTATPYRMATKYLDAGGGYGEVCATIKLINRMKGLFWNRVLFNINIADLIEQDFLCPLEYIDRSVIDHADIPLNKSESDFDIDAFERIISQKENEILRTVAYAQGIAKSVLVFCSSVAQAERLAGQTPESAFISAKTNKKDRERIIKEFKSGNIKTVFNMGVLTTGFDHPSLDAIVLIRPTRSIALYYQMLGRGVRKAEGKTSCKVFDLTSNVKNLGRVETIKLIRREKWELESEIEGGKIASWHNSELYRFQFKLKGTKNNDISKSHLQVAMESVNSIDSMAENGI